jgi:hypothetical protein
MHNRQDNNVNAESTSDEQNNVRPKLFGLSVLFKISRINEKLFKGVSLCAIISAIILTTVCWFLSVNPYNFIVDIKEIIISFLPNILGFSLAGYTLVVGFVQTDMLNVISQKLKNRDYSLYQTMSANFGLTLLFQTFALIVAYLAHFINYFDRFITPNKFFALNVFPVINWLGVFVLSLSFSYALLLTVQIIISIFDFSQLHNYYYSKKKE